MSIRSPSVPRCRRHSSIALPLMIKDAGIAIRHSRGCIISILQGLEMGWRGWSRCVPHTKNKFTLLKRHVFVIEKYIEDVRQDEKHVPDLLEAIMRPTCLVKEELWRNSCKMSQFRPEILKIKVSTFWIPEIRCFPAGGQCQPSR